MDRRAKRRPGRRRSPITMRGQTGEIVAPRLTFQAVAAPHRPLSRSVRSLDDGDAAPVLGPRFLGGARIDGLFLAVAHGADPVGLDAEEAVEEDSGERSEPPPPAPPAPPEASFEDTGRLAVQIMAILFVIGGTLAMAFALEDTEGVIGRYAFVAVPAVFCLPFVFCILCSQVAH